MAHPDIPAEQAHVDRAYECLERMRQALLRTVGAASVGEDGFDIAAGRIEAWVDRRLAAYERAEEILCFGRIDLDSFADPLHIGRRWVHDDDELLVVNWQAPAARPFYTATPSDPHGVRLRRRFRLDGRTLTGISDEALDGSLADAASSVDDFLLEELERARDTRMRDIVATIQADQYGLIARGPEPPLVIQGGPGTGKTAVGLHRASYLLFAHREELRRILVVGPNPVFMDYVSHVLPTLGEDERRPAGDRRARRRRRGHAPGLRYDVERLKADARLADVVAPHGRPSLAGSSRASSSFRLDGHFVGVEADEVERILREAAGRELGVSAAARERFRMNVLRRFYADYGDDPRRPRRARVRRGRARAAEERRAHRLPRPRLAGAAAGAGRPALCSSPVRSSPRRPTGSSSPTSSRCCAGRGPAGAPPTCRSSTRRERSCEGSRRSTGTSSWTRRRT